MTSQEQFKHHSHHEKPVFHQLKDRLNMLKNIPETSTSETNNDPIETSQLELENNSESLDPVDSKLYDFLRTFPAEEFQKFMVLCGEHRHTDENVAKILSWYE